MPPSGYDELPSYGRPPEISYPPEHLPPAAHAKRPRRWPWIACGIVIGVMLIPCLLLALFGGYLFTHIQGPQSTLTTFCDDLKAQRYGAAYDLFSPQLQGQMPRDGFTQAATRRDQVAGPVRACGVNSGNVSIHNDTVILVVTITRNQASTGDVTLIQVGGDWKLDALDPALGLTS
jgi:hypothetical protein